jgi:hypothetical protein
MVIPAPPPKTSPVVVTDAYRPTPRRLLEPNTISMSGASSLGRFRFGVSGSIGFPFVSVRALFGLLDRFDLGLGFDSVYTLLNELRGVARVRLTRGERGAWQAAVVFEGGGAFYTERASREVRGPRWLTGRRNFNFAPGMVFSIESRATRSTRGFVDLRYMLALDTEPFAKDPLEGVPPNFRFTHNLLVKAGAELPLSESTAFFFTLGFDVHAEPRDSRIMPTLGLGLVFGR